jgi:hypothetical protein
MGEKEKNDPYKKYKDFKWENPNEFKNGPIDDDSRKCRDCCCCLLFIIFVLACGFVGYLGFTKGDPQALLYTYDEDGNACGRTKGYEDYPYLYFYSVITAATTLNSKAATNGICVKKCPKDKLGDSENHKNLECKPTKNNPDCKVVKLDYYESKELLSRLCFPKSNDEIEFDPTTQEKIKIYDPTSGATFEKVIDKTAITTLGADNTKYIKYDVIDASKDPQEASGQLINLSFFSNKFASWISDLYATRYAIAASIGWSFVIAMLFLLFLRCCAGFITFVLIMAVQAGLIILAVYFKLNVNDEKEQDEATSQKIMNILFYVFVALSAIWFLFVMIMCNKIRLAVAMVQVTAKYINSTCCIVFVPFFFFILLVVWIAYWIVMCVYLYASGDFDQEGSKVVASFKMDDKLQYCFWFHIFALLYMTAVINAYSQFVYASSACIWYFTSEKGTENHPIAKSFKRGIRYHFGSLAFGALIVAIIQFIMILFEYLKKKVEATAGKKAGKCIKCLISCVQCCLACVAKVMEFINKHAYIQIALKGDSFCTAAWEGFGLIIRNVGRFSVLTAIGGIFSIVGTIFITVASAVVGYFVITKVEYFSAGVGSVILPVIVFGVIGFILGKVTMSIFGVSGDALMHSFLLDEEINKGQPKAFPELQKFMSEER